MATGTKTRKTRKTRTDGHIDNNGSEVLVIRADQLIKDGLYQRTTSKSKVRTISRGFNWKAFGIPTVAPRGDGKYALLDGGHRDEAMRIKFGGTNKKDGSPIRLRVESRFCKNRTEEARIFSEINLNQKNLTKPDFFHAGAVAGDPNVRAITKILTENGIAIAYGQGRTQPNETRCAGVFMDAYDDLGPQKFGFMVRLIVKCYRRDDGSGFVESQALSAAFLRGLAYYLNNTNDTFATIERRLRRSRSASAVLSAAMRDKNSLVFSGWKRPQIVAKHIGSRR